MPEQPEALPPEQSIVDIFREVLGQKVMITEWVTIVEFINEDGATQLAAFASDMPSWRLSGIVEAGHDMLIQEYDTEMQDDLYDQEDE